MRRFLLLAFLLVATPALADPPPRTAAQRDALVARTLADGASRRVLSLLGQSRAHGNRDNERCIDGKLSQIHSFGRMIEERQRRLLEAEIRGDDGLVAHERRVIRRLAVQLRSLEQDAVRCLYPELDGDGRTVVVVTVDRNAPEEDVGAYSQRPRW